MVEGYEPDTNDIIIRQLREEIAKIREEQFARALPTNNVSSASAINSETGIPAPFIGITSTLPAVIRITKDTGEIDFVEYDNKAPAKDFSIGETVTGFTSGTEAVIGDIDITGTDTGILYFVPGTLTGTGFEDDERLDGSIAGTNVADANGDGDVQVGRGHLNAGAGSIIAESTTPPAEIHFIDNAQKDGQIIYLRAQDGQTIRLRRPMTSDSTTGNLDIDESFDIGENAIILLQYQVASNASPTGGWIPLITDVTSAIAGTTFPILYPQEDLGTQNGTIDLSLNQPDGHYKQITLDGDADLTFSNLPPSINGFKFYVVTNQDSTGGWVYTGLPSSVKNASSLLSQLDTSADSQTVWQFVTADGGTTWHGQRIDPSSGGGDNLGNHMAEQDLDMKTFNIINLDVLRYAKGTEPGADSIIGFNVYGSAVENDTKMKWSIPASESGQPRFYEWQVDLAPIMRLEKPFGQGTRLDMLEGTVQNTKGITFSHLPLTALSSIIPDGVELKYDNGFGAGGGGFHGFHVAGSLFAQFEVREDVNRSNVDLDMITNDINQVDQIQFDQFGGFNSLINHGERRITGGASGIVMNIPKISPFAGGFNIWFENDALTDSTQEYRFDKTQFTMFGKPIADVLALLFTNGGNISDQFTHILFQASNSPVQTLLFKAGDGVSLFDLMEITGTEHNTTNAGGVKFFTDVNLNTQDLTNVDRLHFNSNNGIVGGNQTAIAGEGTDMQFNVPINREFSFRTNDVEFMELRASQLHLRTNPSITHPSIISDGSFILALNHLNGTTGMFDGEFRKVSGDVIVRTGGNDVNLSSIGAGSASLWSQFPALQSVDMANFSFTNFLGWTAGVGQTFDVGGAGATWNLPGFDSYFWRIGGSTRMTLTQFVLGMNGLRIEQVGDPIGLQDAVNLQTLQASLGDFVSEDDSPVTWTGIHSFNGTSTSINSSTIILGDSSSDNIFINGRISSSLVPDSDGSVDIGTGGLRWRSLILSNNLTTNTATFSGVANHFANIDMNNFKITNHATPTNSSDVATKGYVDSVAGGLPPNVVTTDTDQTITGTKIFTSGGSRFSSDLRVDGNLEMNGDLNHDGNRVGFYGRAPQLKQNAVLADFTTAGNANAINTLIGILQNMGLVGP